MGNSQGLHLVFQKIQTKKRKESQSWGNNMTDLNETKGSFLSPSMCHCKTLQGTAMCKLSKEQAWLTQLPPGSPSQSWPHPLKGKIIHEKSYTPRFTKQTCLIALKEQDLSSFSWWSLGESVILPRLLTQAGPQEFHPTRRHMEWDEPGAPT